MAEGHGEAEGIVFFQAGGMAFALYPRDELAKDANVASDGHGFGGITLAYNARTREEVDSVLAEAKAAGARIAKRAAEAFWGGYSGYFADPDGPFVGGRLESVILNCGGRKYSGARVSSP